MLSQGRGPSVSGCKFLSQFVQLSVSVSLFHLPRNFPSFSLSCLNQSTGSPFKASFSAQVAGPHRPPTRYGEQHILLPPAAHWAVRGPESISGPCSASWGEGGFLRSCAFLGPHTGPLPPEK